MLFIRLVFHLATQQVFHLECLLLFWIKSQPGIVYKSDVYKKACNIVFKSSKNENLILPNEFIFVFILYFIGAILLKKSCQKHGALKIYEKGGMAIKRGAVYRRGAQIFCTLSY